ncbi:MAG TPA: O-methyltransferase [Microbacteriaceae bacterium]|nr:O-methyltransferase [Microbacteriaceae bacterium]
MSKTSSWKFAGELVVEDDILTTARTQSLELGIEAIEPAVGAQARLVVAASRARSIIEIGTGAGVSGLWLLGAGGEASLTSIDVELDFQQHAREYFSRAGVHGNRVRLITGRALDVLPRMNENSYDIVFVDADPRQVIECFEHALRLARQGGIILVPHALWKDRVAEPARRDAVTAAFRTLLAETAVSDAVTTAVSPAGDGLLQVIKKGA